MSEFDVPAKITNKELNKLLERLEIAEGILKEGWGWILEEEPENNLWYDEEKEMIIYETLDCYEGFCEGGDYEEVRKLSKKEYNYLKELLSEKEKQ